MMDVVYGEPGLLPLVSDVMRNGRMDGRNVAIGFGNNPSATTDPLSKRGRIRKINPLAFFAFFFYVCFSSI